MSFNGKAMAGQCEEHILIKPFESIIGFQAQSHNDVGFFIKCRLAHTYWVAQSNDASNTAPSLNLRWRCKVFMSKLFLIWIKETPNTQSATYNLYAPYLDYKM